MFILQVTEINHMIKSATQDSMLYRLPLVEDPSEEIADALVKYLKWNMLSREWNLSVSDLSTG
jgi:hypothetical protein